MTLLTIINALSLMTVALLLRCGMLAVRQMAGRAPLAVPMRAISTHPQFRSRVRPAEMLIACQSLRAPPTPLALRRRVYAGVSSLD
jgi:hypothetical protein